MTKRRVFRRGALRVGFLLLLLPVLSHRTRAQVGPTTVLSFPSIADTYVDSSSATSNFGTAATLKVLGGSRTQIAYLRFAVNGLNGRTVQRARVKLGVSAGSTTGDTAHIITNNAWNETAVNYNTRPAVDGPGLSTLGSVATGATAEFVLDGAITSDGVYNVAVDTTSTSSATYTAANASSGQKPTLELTVVAVPPTVTISQPANASGFFVGDTVTFQGTARDSANTDLGTRIAWSSNLDGALGTGATINTAILRQGTHTIIASATDNQNVTGSTQITITMNPRPPANTEPLVSITAPTSAHPLVAGSQIVFTGTANDFEDGDLSASLAWTSDRDGALGTGASFTHALSEGTHVLSASVTDHGGLTGMASVTVTVQPGVALEFPAIADAAVDSSIPNTTLGADALLRADANAVRVSYLRFVVSGVGTRNILGASLRLQVDSTPGADSDSGGVLRTLTDGTWQEGTLTYNNRPPVDGQTLATMGRVSLGQTVDFDATAGVTGDGTYNFAIVNFSSDEADYRSREGGPAPKLIVTIAGTPPNVNITAPANNAVYFKNDTVTFTGTAHDAEEGDIGSRIEWSSSRDGALGTGTVLPVSTLSAGTHTITASAADADGLRGQSSITIRVRNPNVAPTVRITGPANGTSVPAGTSVALSGTATDDFDGDLSSQLQWTSNRDGALFTGASRSMRLSEGTHTLTAAVSDSDHATGSATVQVTVAPTAPTVTISAPANGTTVFTGSNVTFTGSANDATDGNVSAALRWSSDRDGLIGTGATVSTNRLTTGAHTITAAAADHGGLIGQAQIAVVVRPPNVPPTLTIEAPVAGTTLLTGKPVMLAATATDPEDGNVAANVRWSSSVAGNLGTGGIVIVPSLAVGSHVLTATVTDRDNASATASVTVTIVPATLTFNAVADTYVNASKATTKFGTAADLWADNSPVLQAFLRFTVSGMGRFGVQQALLRLKTTSASTAPSNLGGEVHSITNNTWSEAATTYNNRPAIDGPTLATRTTAVAASTVVDFDVTQGVRADGTYNFGLITTSSDEVVYASREASSGQPQLIVNLSENQAPVVRITAPASGTKANPGTPVVLTGTAIDAEAGDLSGQIQWSSNLDGVIGTGASITVSALRSGVHTITARATDAGNLSGQAQITLRITSRPVITITAPANGAAFFTSQLPVTFTGTAVDAEDGTISGHLGWRSDRDGALAAGASISVSQLSIGTHVITAAATDDDGLTGEGQITIKVRGPNQPPQVVITAPANGTSVPAGTSITLAGTASDDFDGDISTKLSWRSSRDGLLGTGASRPVTLSEGTHTLTASVTDSDGAPASAQIQVTIAPSPPVVTITSPATGTRVFAGSIVAFTATAVDPTDGNVAASLAWTSDRDGTIGSGPSFSTNHLSTGTHVVTATAMDHGGLTASARATVVIRPPNVPPVVIITTPTDGGQRLAGKPVLLNADAIDAEDGDISAMIRWTSNRDGALGTAGTLVVPSLTPGTHILTAAVTDHDGASVTATHTVTIVPATMTFSATADTYVDASAASSKFGTATTLWADNSPVKQAFLRFSVTGLGDFTVQQGLLRLKTDAAKTAPSNLGGSVHLITNNSWSEASTTYATRPAIDGPVIATRSTAVAASTVVDFDVTSALSGNGTYNFALDTTSIDEVVYASREAASGQPQLVVNLSENQAPVVRITAPASGARFLPGATVPFTATAADAENGDLSAQILWRSDRDGALGTGGSLPLATLSPGTHIITARVTDTTGLSSQAQITIDIAHPPTVSILAPGDGSIFFTDQLPVLFTGRANDFEDGDLGTSLQWRSDRDGPLATGPSVSASSLSVGTHVITASVTDADGLAGQGQITIRVRTQNVAPTIRITSPADNSSVPAGMTAMLAVSAIDDFDGDISNMVHWSSSKDGPLFTGASRTILLSEGSHVLTASITDSDGASNSAQIRLTVTPTPPVVTITAPADGTRVFAGTNVTFTGTAIDPTDGNMSAGIRWTSDRDGLLGSGATLTVSRLTPGTHTITAAASDTGGLVGQAQRTVIIRPANVPPMVTILSPTDGATLLTGKPVVLGATALDTEDGDLSATIHWTSSRDGALGTGATVLKSSLSAGAHTLTATVTDADGATGTASVTVSIVNGTLTLSPIADTYVDAGTPTKALGTQTSVLAGSSPDRQAFFRFQVGGVGSLKVQQALLRLTVGPASADGSLVGGTLRSITNNAWSEAATIYTNRPAVDGAILTTKAKVAAKAVVDFDATAGVTRDGTYNFALVSTSSDFVRYNTREATSGKPQLLLTLTQNTAPVVNITAPLPNATVNIGAPVTLNATAIDAESGNLSAQIQWTSSLDGAIGTGASIVTSRLRPGVHTITAQVTDAGGLTGQAQIILNVGHKPQVAINTPRDRAVFFTAQLPITFTGSATDFEDGNMTGRLQWSSDRDGPLGTGPSVTRSLTVGTHVITAAVTDTNAQVGQAQITIKVRGPNVAPVLTITAPTDGSSTRADTPVTLTATANDDFDGDISSLVLWTSNLQNALFQGATKTMLLREGSQTITASITDSDGATTTAQVHVTITPTPPVVTITTPAPGAVLVQDVSNSFNATALDATDGDLSAQLAWTSSIDGPIGTGASFATTTLSPGAHTITASVTDAGGLVGTAQLSLRVIRIPSVTILLPEANNLFLQGNDVTFFATAQDSVDGDVSSSLVWTSDRDGQIGTGPSFTKNNLSIGTHVVTAKAKNSENNVGQSQVTLTVHVGALTFDPIQDTYGDEAFATTKFGTSPELDAGSTSPTRKQSFLRFQVTGIAGFPVVGTKLQLTVGTSSTASGGAGGQVNAMTNNTWSESTVTWKTLPAIDGPTLGNYPLPVVQGQHIEIDLGATAVRQDGTYNFALTSASSDAVKYESRESLTTANRPHLVVMLGQPATRHLPQVTITAPTTVRTFFDDDTVAFAASATDATDGDISATITWTSNRDGALGTGASIAKRLSRGTHTITAAARNSTGLVGRATVLVTINDRPPTVTITAPQDGKQFPIGFPAAFSATATDDIDGDLGAGIVWTSDRDGRIGTGRSITVSNLSTGDHRITASATNSLNVTGTGSIGIAVGNAAPKITVSAPADATTVAEGTSVTFTATATDLEDGDLTSHIAWVSDLQGPLGTGGTVPVVLTTTGAHHVTATVADSNGLTRSVALGITVTPAPPALTIVSPADGFSTSGSVTFSATARDFKDGDLSPQIKWTSNVAGTLGTGGTITANRLATGRHVITASVLDSDNLLATQSITIGIGNTPPNVTITQPANGFSAAAGTSITFRASAVDTTDGDVSASIRWSSQLNGALGSGPSVVTANLARGTHVITATAVDTKGLSNSTSIIVSITASSTTQAPQVTISAPASGGTVDIGQAVTFSGTAVGRAGNLAAGLSWVSDQDGVIGSGASFSTSTLSPGGHRITASVSDSGGLVGSASISLTVNASSVSFPVVADSFTDNATANQSTNFGTQPYLRLNSSSVQRPYLRFVVSNLSPGPIQRAVVRMQTTSATNSGSDSGGEIHTVSAPWDELTITHLNKPALDAAIISSVAGPLVPSQNVDYDVTSVVTGNGTYDFGLKTLSVDRAEFVSKEGGAGAPQLIIFRNAPTGTRPIVKITSPADAANIPSGTPATLTATATDPQDGNVAASIVWRSDKDGVLGNGASINATLSTGAHILTATATDSIGNTGTDLVHVNVGSGGPTVTILAPAAAASAPLGQPVPFIGTAFDTKDGDLSFSLQWSSDIDGPIGTGPSFLRTLSPGTHTITATVVDSDTNRGTATSSFTVTTTRIGYEDFSYGLNIEVALDHATATKPQSKLWYTPDGVWWAMLFVVSKSEYHIHRMDMPTQTWIDTGIPVDDRGKSRADCMFDAATGKLYVASRYGFGVTPPQNRLYRFTYFQGAQTYALDAGFPVNLDGGGCEALTIAKAATGTLWIAYTVNGQVFVNYTIGGDDHVWSPPFFLPAPEGNPATPNDDAAVEWLPGNPGRIGVLWGNQTTQKWYFAYHIDGDPKTTWHFEIAASGSAIADDHMNMKVASDGRLFAAVKTSRSTPGQTLVGLLVRSVDGTWSPLIKVTNYDFNPTRPNVVLDEINRRVYVFYALNFSDVYYKVSDMDSISFDTTGGGTPLMVSGTHPLTPSQGGQGGINNVTTTKQVVDQSTGVPILASTTETDRYWHNWILLPRPKPDVAITSPADGIKVKSGTALTFTGIASSQDGLITSSIQWSSSRDGNIGAGGSFTKSNLTAGTHTITASATDSAKLTGSASITITVENDAPPVVTISSPTNGQKFRPGQTITFTGTALDSLDGDRTASMTWTSDRDGLLGTGGSFTHNDLSLGRHNVTVRATDAGGLARTVTFVLDVAAVSNPTLTLLSPPTGKKFAFGAAVPFSATANDNFDGDISSRITWSSDRDGSIGTGGSFNRATLTRGTHTISAVITNSATLSASASTTVAIEDDAPPVVTISAPTKTLFASGKPVTFTGTAVDSIDGNRTASIVWTSNRDGQIGTGGTFTTSSLSVGTHTVTAAATDLNGLTGLAQVTLEVRVQPAPTVTITTPADNTKVLFTNRVTFTATATDTIDGDVAASLQWSSSIDGNLGTGPTITTSSLSIGQHTITATATNSGPVTGSAVVHLTVASGPQISIFQPADASVFAQGDPITFSGLAFDFEDGDVSSRLQWTSSRDGALGTGGSLTLSTLSRGVHTITVSATDNDSNTASVVFSLEVVARPTVFITAPATGTVFGFGQAITFTGFATDPVDGNLNSTLMWSSSLDGSLGTGASLSVSTLRSGTHTITAKATNRRNLTGQKTITVIVNDPPVVTITAPIDGSRATQGTAVTFTATATDREDGDVVTHLLWTSNRDGALGNGGSITVSTLSSGVHTITATATDSGGLTTSATRTITISGKPTVRITTPANGTRLNIGDTVTLSGTASDFEDGDISSQLAWTSDHDGALGTGATITASLTAGTHSITARVIDHDGNSGQAVVTVIFNAPPMVHVTAPANNANFGHAVPVVFTATASDPEDGDVSNSVVWSSNRDGSLGTGATISVSTLSSGTHTITATATDAQHASASGAISIVVNGAPVVTITAPTTGTNFLPGAPASFTATAQDFEEGDISSRINWSSNRDGNLGTGGTISKNTLSVGTHTITASVTDNGGKPGSMQVTITVNTPPTLTITGPANNATYEPGAPATFTATASDVEDGDLTSRITWTSSRDGALGSGGSVTTSTLSTGTHTITASVTDNIGKTVTSTVTITVNATPTVHITAPANNASPEPGAPVTFTASALDAEDGDLSTGIVWTSDRDGLLGTGASITKTTLSTGTHTITAAATDLGGKRGTATITVVVNATPTVAITAPANNSTYEKNQPIVFTGTATDPEDGSLTSGLVWTSDRDGQIGTGGTIIVATLSSGTHTITAAATDVGGKTGRATVTVVVNSTPTVAISAPVTSSSYEHGAPVTFTGTATDLEQGNITSALVWTSDRDGQIGTGFTFTTALLSSGTHTITAAATDAGNKTGTATITVVINSTPTVTITAPADHTSPEPGAAVAFTATATDLEDGDLTSQIVWTSDRDGSLGTGGSITKSTLSTGTHVITAAATDHGSKHGSASITITVDATPTVTITAPGDHTSPEPGTLVTFTATAIDAEDGDIATLVNWTSDRDGLLGTGATLTTSTLTTGTHVITASATETHGGKTGHASITVVVNATPAVAITTPANNAAYEPGTAITFTGTATDAEDGNLATSIAWTSDRDGSLGTGASVTRTLTTGLHTITATVTDQGGKSAHTMIHVLVDATPAVTIVTPATNSTFEHGATIAFTATATDTEDGNLGTAIHWSSNHDGDLGTGATLDVSSLSSGTHVITAAATDAAGRTGQTTITVVVNSTPAVAITAPTTGSTYEPGAAVTFTGTATDLEDGSLTSAMTWTSDRDGSLGTGGSITVSTLSHGTHTITAAATDNGGKTGHATITVVVNATPTVAIDTPATGSTFEPATPITFSGSANDAEDGSLSASMDWTSSQDGSLGRGASISHGLTSGTHTIVASVSDSGGKSNSTAITVVVNATPTVAISAPAMNSTYEPGAPATFTATAHDAEQGDLTSGIHWSSDRDGSLGTGGSITKTTLTAGTHVVTATITDNGGKQATASVTITVDATPTVAVTLPTNDATFEPAAPVTFTATAHDAEQGDLTSEIVWTSDRDGALGTGGSITKSNLTTGTHHVTVTAIDTYGKVGSAAITITVDATPSVTIDLPANGATYEPGATVTLTATASDVEDGSLTTHILWSSDLDGGLGMGGTVTTSTLHSGTHVITVSATDSAGKTGTQSVTITIDATPTVGITAPANGSTYEPGATVEVTGTAHDAEQGDLSAAIAWVVDGVPAGSSASIMVGPLASGSHTIGATITDNEGKSATTSITIAVDATPTVGITAPANGSTYEPGATVEVTGTAHDAEQGDLSAAIAWVVDGVPAGSSASIMAGPLASGSHTIGAMITDNEGKSATTSITIAVDATPTVGITAPANGSTYEPGATVEVTGTAHDAEQGDLSAAIAWVVDGVPAGSSASIMVGPLASGSHTIGATITDNEGKSATTSITIAVDATPTVGITAPANGSTYEPGATVEVTATAHDAEQGDLSAAIAWVVDGVPAGSSASIMVGPLTSGSHTIGATITDSEGKSATTSITIAVDGTPAVEITAPANGSTYEPGATVEITASANDAEQGDVSAAIAWVVDGVPAGSGASIMVGPLTSGSHTIGATIMDSEGKSATTSITIAVDGTPTVGITAPPNGSTYEPGATVEVTGTAHDVEQGDLTGSIAWVVDGVPAGSSASVMVGPLASGSHTISATITDNEGKSATTSITITVDATPTIEISAPADNSTYEPGETVEITASANDTEQGDMTTEIVWTFDGNAQETEGGTITVGPLVSGTHTVTASVTDSQGKSRTATITMTANGTPAVVISAPGMNSYSESGTPVTFTATATDPEENDLSGALAWSSDVDGALDSGASITVDTLSPGTHTITASVTDGGGKTGTATVTVTILAPSSVTILQPADDSSVDLGTVVAFQASALAGAGSDISGSIVWTLDGSTEPFGTGGSASQLFDEEASHTVTASVTDAAGVTRTATITVHVVQP